MQNKKKETKAPAAKDKPETTPAVSADADTGNTMSPMCDFEMLSRLPSEFKE